MSTVTVGTGPLAMRVRFAGSGAQLRHGALIIDLNEDATRLVQMLVSHSSPAAIDESGDMSIDTLCTFLRALACEGIPLGTWGDPWEGLCAASGTPDREDQQRDSG